MKSHVQNPWTRSPQLFVHMSVEEANQLAEALALLGKLKGIGEFTSNQWDALCELGRNLDHALSNEPPRGIKGCIP